MLAIMDKLSTHDPGTNAAQRKEMIHLRLVLHCRLQIHVEIQIVQQVNHEIVNYVRLIAFTERVHVDWMLRKEQPDPLQKIMMKLLR